MHNDFVTSQAGLLVNLDMPHVGATPMQSFVIVFLGEEYS